MTLEIHSSILAINNFEALSNRHEFGNDGECLLHSSEKRKENYEIV
jgi:hypothetical protein